MKKLLLIAGLLITFFTACKKSKPAEETPTSTTTTSFDLIRDSVFLYAKEDYYWYDALPDYTTFNPRSFTSTVDELTALKAELFKITQYKVNPTTNSPYEYSGSTTSAKYSYIDEGEANTRLSAVVGDFGFAPIYVTTTDIRVKYVYAGSPADLAGLKRGYQILSINGRSDLTYDASSGSANINFVVNAYANSSTITMVVKKPDGSTATVNMSTATYKVNPIITYKTIDLGSGKKVGYIVFNSFVALASTQDALVTAFNSFTAAGITDLVVDFRYNGGGYVQTAEFLSNLIAPTSANTKVMYSTYYNSKLAANNNSQSLLKNQVRRDANNQLYNYSQIDFSVAGNTETFAKSGTLNLSRVFFLVTGSTASASELTINNLRPYMNVQIIGSKTYGKPVGFFDIRIGKYYMYLSEFETKNSSGQGGYYAGMTPASTDYPGFLATEDPTKDFGDVTETLLAKAIKYINTGSYNSVGGLTTQSVEEGTSSTLSADEQRAFNAKIDPHNFNGMIMKKPVLLK